MSSSVTDTRQERIGGGAFLRAGIILLGFGVLWGWAWFSAVHVIPYFFVIAPLVDVTAYAVTGSRVNRELRRYQVTSAQYIGLAVLAISPFYLGNRVLWLTLLAGFSSFTENTTCGYVSCTKQPS